MKISSISKLSLNVTEWFEREMNMKPNFNIDIVVPWVDGQDPEWLHKKNVYEDETSVDSRVNGDERYRDMGTFEYFFQGIKKFATWAHKVYVITDNQKPKFEIDDNRVIFIDHKDYIPTEYLPTFNSNTIEMNIDLIHDLSEHFVLFNDDTILISPTEYTDFFSEKGVPKDCGAFEIFRPFDDFSHIVLNDLKLINDTFDKTAALKNHGYKYWGTSCAKPSLARITGMADSAWLGWVDPHLPMRYTKTLFKTVHKEFPHLRNEQGMRRFRTPLDISHWLVRYYRLATGEFMPSNICKLGCTAVVKPGEEQPEIRKAFSKNKKIVLLSDQPMRKKDFELAKKSMDRLFFEKFNECEG